MKSKGEHYISLNNSALIFNSTIVDYNAVGVPTIMVVFHKDET